MRTINHAMDREIDPNEPFHFPIQETCHDSTRSECCTSASEDRWSFLKSLPPAASFMLDLTTLVSLTKDYFGRELVFIRKKKAVSRLPDSLLSVHSSQEPSIRKYSASRSSDESNNDHSHSCQEPSRPPVNKQFSNSASPPLVRKDSRQARTSSNHSPSNAFSHQHTTVSPQEHISRPTIHTSSAITLPRPSLHTSHIQTTPFPSAVIHEQFQTHSTNGEGEPIAGDGHHQELLKVSAECLHAQDYSHMKRVLSSIKVDSSTDEGVALAVSFGLGQANFKMKLYSLAETYFSQLDARARQLGDRGKGDVSIGNYYLGEICFIRSKYEKASEHYRTALEFHSKQVSVAKLFKVIPPSRSGLFTKLAASLRNSSKMMQAISSYREAIATGTAKKDRLSAHTSLGNLLQNVGENSQAVEEYLASIQLSEELGDKVSLGWAHGNIGNAYLGMHYRDKAIHHLKLALELTLEHEPTPSAIGRAFNNLGTAYQALNELDQAQEYYDLALAQAIYGGDQAGQARVYGNIGNLQMLLKKYDGSIAHYTETLNTTKDKSTKITAHHNRGCASYEKAESEKRKFYVTAHSSFVSSNSVSSAAEAEREAKKLYSLTYHGEVLGDIEGEHQLPVLPTTIQRRYRKALDDLSFVVEQHELSFRHIKGSPKGLTLSVSLFETNSRTFHRLLDCHYNLGEWEKALVYAEQSRARTLGELLLERKRQQLDVELVTPLDMKQINKIVEMQDIDVVVVSYTGSRLLVWVLSPGQRETGEREVRRAMFQVTLEEDGFEGKSLDYYLHYLLSEELVEKNVEMYAFSDYQTTQHVMPTVHLHDLFAKPLLKVLACLHPTTTSHVQEIIFIPDSYINLLPLVALFNKTLQEFLGDRYRFRIMPSLLSMGILNQMPPVVVQIPQDGNKFCVVGNPTIPVFSIKGKTWSLGKLPFATEEAEWVSYILGCNPTLHEQATRSVVMMMISGARMVHIATHGSAASGFLAFASLGNVSSYDPVDESSVLIYPEDIEKMVIAPALVVLSSCDSGRGTVKADGVLGMARAFILAGAQAIMTTLWRVPDESAAVFMKFFYQYLVGGHLASVSLQKAILSVRSFSKYSGFIHWSGYQLTGREVRICVAEKETERAVRCALGGEGLTVFPRLDLVQALQKELIEKSASSDGNTLPPTDVQVIHGSHGLKPAGPVRDFVLRNHAFFSGGIFWLNCTTPDLLNGGVDLVNTVESADPVLVVMDSVKSLPKSKYLQPLLRNRTTHIIVISHSSQPPETLRKEIDQQLIRGCSLLTVQPLSTVHTTQRIVYSIMSRTHFTPLNREQIQLEKMAGLTSGCPALVDLTTALLQRCLEETEKHEGSQEVNFLDRFAAQIPLLSEARAPHAEPRSPASESVGNRMTFKTNSYTSELISAFQLPPADDFLLHTLSVFAPVPIPLSVIDIVQSLVVKATQGSMGSGRGVPNSIRNLSASMLLRPYPAPVISSINRQSTHHHLASSLDPPSNQNSYFFVPQLVQDSLWEHMEETDVVFAITTAYKAVMEYGHRPELSYSELCFATGLADVVVTKCDANRTCIPENVYKEACKLLINLQLKNSRNEIT